MAKVSIKVESFSGGIADDIREARADKFAITKHFDIFSNPKRLTPYRSLEADTNDGSTPTGMKQYFVRDFVYASASPKLYGLGQTGAGLTKIVYKADATTGNWTLPASSEGNGAVKNGCLLEYKDKLWGFQGTTQVFSYGLLSGVPTITNSAGTVAAITSVAQGIIAKDDNGYLPYNNKLVRINAGGTVQDAVLTLPTNFKITSLATYGNYLAIACAPVSSYNGASKVFLWNLTSPDVQEAIDWGEGELRVLDTIEGALIGVTDRYLNNVTGAGRGALIVQTYSGGYPQVVKEVFTQALSGKTMPTSKAVVNGRLFFSAKIMTNAAGTEYNEGIWSFGRKGVGYQYALTCDIIDENVNGSGIQAFGTAANYFFVAHSADGSIDKTNDTAAYGFTSVYESRLFDFDNAFSDKNLDFVRVFFRRLVDGETVTAKYKVDGESTWTLIGTFSTAGQLSRTFTNIEALDTAFKSGREFQFRFESTGGAELAGYELEANTLNNP
jgi:hypothetical protein